MDAEKSLKNIVNLSMSAVGVSLSTAKIYSSSRHVQSVTASMASAVEELSASMSEIEVSTSHSAEVLQESRRLSVGGMQELRELREMIVATDRSFDTVGANTDKLRAIVGRLSAVVDLIGKIASQTNLLALNATIEAARAGQHGAGFTVVATEVKGLSRQTSDATESIKHQIEDLNAVFNEVLGNVTGAQDTMRKVVGKAESVANDFGVIDRNTDAVTDQVSELLATTSQQKEAVGSIVQNMITLRGQGESNLSALVNLADQTDHSIKLIEEWRSELASEDIKGKVIYLAKADHMLWKKRLLDTAVGRTTLKSSELADHTMCRLGKWLHGDSITVPRGSLELKAIDEPHRRVHASGIEAAKCFEAGRLDEGLAHFEDVDVASLQVIDALDKFALKFEALA